MRKKQVNSKTIVSNSFLGAEDVKFEDTYGNKANPRYKKQKTQKQDSFCHEYLTGRKPIGMIQPQTGKKKRKPIEKVLKKILIKIHNLSLLIKIL